MEDVGVLLKCLELEWNDHFQTRAQTWRTLQIEAVIAAGLIGIDVRLESATATVGAAVLLVIATTFGALITLRHREVEQVKFKHIIEIERRLGLVGEGAVLEGVRVPSPIRLVDAAQPRKSNTALFILRMHLTLMAFGILYAASRLAI
jgi:hypothetical protein